jgi:predicted N-acyltransferase
MSLEVRLAHSVAEVGQQAWDRLSDGRPFTSFRWYQFGERVRAADTPIYIILSQTGEDVARATLWLTKQEPLPIQMRLVRYLLAKMLGRWPLLICRSPIAGAAGLILPAPPLREAALEVIAQTAQAEARRHQALFVAFVYLEKEEAQAAGWLPEFIAVELPEAGTHLRFTWESFEDYLKHRPKEVRQHYRRIAKHAAELGLETKPVPLTAVAVDEALALIRNVEKRFHEPPNPWTRALLENADAVEGSLLVARAHGQLAGCGVVLKDGQHTLTTALGLDYRLPYVYFQLCYAGIAHATELGARDLWWGSGAYEVKQRLGFKLTRNTYSVFASRWAALQKISGWLAKNQD